MGRRQQVAALKSAENQLDAQRQRLQQSFRAQASALRSLGPVRLIGIGFVSGVLTQRLAMLVSGTRLGSFPLVAGLRLWRAVSLLQAGISPIDGAP